MNRILFALTLFLAPALPSVQAEDHALLIGVSEYPQLEKEHWLRGPENDVELVSEILGSHFKFKADNIRTLTGWPKDKKARPTKANIRQAFSDLAAKAGEKDMVFVLMSGHGCQQPANPDPADLEPDGLDELFLPADTAKWDPSKKTVEGAIVDDEIREWVDEIRKTGAFVWIIFDSCHSGTMTRGTAHEGRVNRRIDPADLIPEAVMKGMAGTARGGSLALEKSGEFSKSESGGTAKGGIVAMYAAQSLEPTFEMPLPTQLDKFHGLFTFMLMQILAGVEQPLTYRDLADTVSMVYRANGIMQPTPLIEGSGLDHEVLGRQKFSNRPPIKFTGRVFPPAHFEVDAGHFMGLGAGSVIEVYPPAAAPDADKPLGVAIVEKSFATTALVTPKKWKRRDPVPAEKIGAGSRAAIVYEKVALDNMTVAVQMDDGDEIKTVTVADLEGKAADFVKRARKSGKTWNWGNSLKGANWILRFSDSDPVLIPASGWSAAFAKGGGDEALSPPEFRVENPEMAGAALGRIARTRQLVNIAGAGNLKFGVKMEVTLLRFSGSGDMEGKPVTRDAGGRILRSGEEIAFRIRNPGSTSIDVSLLFVDSGYGITAIFPEPGTVDDNRIPPGKTLVTPRLEVTAETAGPEQVVALGIRSTRDRVDFGCLEQPSLERTRGAPALDTPLGELLKGAVYGEGETRGLVRSVSSDHGARLITWWTLPQPD